VTSVSYAPAESTGHTGTPAPGGRWTTSGGKPASPWLRDHYPLFTACKVCGGRIRLASLLQVEWSGGTPRPARRPRPSPPCLRPATRKAARGERP
jgi:hypothetical protein